MQIPIRRVITDEDLPENVPRLYAPMPQDAAATPSMAPLTVLPDLPPTADSSLPARFQSAEVLSNASNLSGEDVTARRHSSASDEATELSERPGHTGSASSTERRDGGYAEATSTAPASSSDSMGSFQAAQNVTPTPSSNSFDNESRWLNRLKNRTPRGSMCSRAGLCHLSDGCRHVPEIVR